MGRPIFRVFHNMIPVWIAVLRLLKNAPKTLPASVKQTKGAAQYLVANAIKCGNVQTDSFRYEKQVLPLRCARPQTDSFRVVNSYALQSLMNRDSELSVDVSEYNTASSSIESTDQGSQSRSSSEYCNKAEEEETGPEERTVSFNLAKSNEIMKRSGDASGSSYPSIACAEGSGSVQGEEEFRKLDATASAHDCFALVHGDSCTQTNQQKTDLSSANPRSDPCYTDKNQNKAGNVFRRPRRKALPSGRSYRSSSMSFGPCSNSSSRSRSSCSSRSSRKSTSPSNPLIAHHGDAFVKYSNDPYCDFIASITDMIVANNLKDYHDLEDLFRCFLHLNSPRQHSIITLAFLEAMARLDALITLQLRKAEVGFV